MTLLAFLLRTSILQLVMILKFRFDHKITPLYSQTLQQWLLIVCRMIVELCKRVCKALPTSSLDLGVSGAYGRLGPRETRVTAGGEEHHMAAREIERRVGKEGKKGWSSYSFATAPYSFQRYSPYR